MNVDNSVAKLIDGVKSSVFAVITTVYFQTEQGTQKAAISQGTGFLMTDGTFVTARHCVEPWLFNLELNKYYALTLRSNVYKMYAVIAAYNNQGEQLQIRSEKFTVDDSYDEPRTVTIEIGGESHEIQSKLGFGTEASLGNDWAFCKVGKAGKIKNGKAFSANLKSGTTAHVLGFPQGAGIGDGKTLVEPIYNKLSIVRDGLTKARCIMVNQGIDHGNSGGPVFIVKDGQLYVVGIVSRGDFNSKFYNHLIPMSNL